MLFKPERLPCNVHDMFGRDLPLVMELGFGNGSFLLDQARANPGVNYLGAERSLSSLTRAFRVLARSSLTNVRLYPGDGRFVLGSVLPPRSLSHLWINFPDPWPRRRHTSRRLMSSEFFELLADRLVLDGTVSLTTDHQDYFDFARREGSASGLFEERVTRPPTDTLRTRYAQKWAKRERSFYHVTFTLRKHGEPQPADVILQEMQHAHLSGILPKVSTFEKSAFPLELGRPLDDGKIVLLDVFKALDNDGLVFLVLVEEGSLKQEILIEVANKGEVYQAFVRKFGGPLPTKGIGRAMNVVVGWLQECGMKLEGTWY